MFKGKGSARVDSAASREEEKRGQERSRHRRSRPEKRARRPDEQPSSGPGRRHAKHIKNRRRVARGSTSPGDRVARAARVKVGRRVVFRVTPEPVADERISREAHLPGWLVEAGHWEERSGRMGRDIRRPTNCRQQIPQPGVRAGVCGVGTGDEVITKSPVKEPEATTKPPVD